MNQKICDKTRQILTCAALPHPSSFLPITAKMLPQAKLLDPWIFFRKFCPISYLTFIGATRKIMPRTSCKTNCRFRLLYQQSLARRNHYLNVANGLQILLSFDDIVDVGLPGWPKMREARSKKNIKQHIHAYRKANKCVKNLSIIITEGCDDCQVNLQEVYAQEKIADAAEAAAEEAERSFREFLNGDSVNEVLETVNEVLENNQKD